MQFRWCEMKIGIKLLLIGVIFSLTFACAYAANENQKQQPKQEKHRTARLVRDFSPEIAQRMQTLDYPSYNIPNAFGPGTYAFGYEIEDPATGNVQFRDEEKLQNGTVRGSFGYMLPDGNVVITRFIADFLGYRANTEIKRPDGQILATIPTRSPQANIIPTGFGPNRNPYFNQPAPYQPAPYQPAPYQPAPYQPVLNPNYIDPQYSAAILNHIKNQQYNPTQGLMQSPNGASFPQTAPMLPQEMSQNSIAYDTPSNGNMFSNFFSQFPQNLNPGNLYNNLQSTFPNIIPQQNPLNTLASNVQNGFGNFVSNAQSQFQQLIPQNGPFANWFNPNRFQQQQQLQLQQQQQQLGGGAILGDTGVTGVGGGVGSFLGGHRVPTTKRRRTPTTKRKNGLKTRDGADGDWLDDFLENRKREMMFGLTTTTPETVTVTTGEETVSVLGRNS